MSQTEARPWTPMTRTGPGPGPVLAHPVLLLIQVPSVAAPPRPAGQAAAQPRPMAQSHRRRPKRRLRRELRIAGGSLLAVLPVAAALAFWPAGMPTRAMVSRVLAIHSPAHGNAQRERGLAAGAWSSASAISSSPPVLLSVEALGTTADSETDAPVVFPGYLLPDDSHEEPAHEGS